MIAKLTTLQAWFTIKERILSFPSLAHDSSYHYSNELSFFSSECIADPVSLNKSYLTKKIWSCTHKYSGSSLWTFSVELKFEAMLLWQERNDWLQGEIPLRKDKKQLLQTQCTCVKGIGDQTQTTAKKGKFPTVSS